MQMSRRPGPSRRSTSARWFGSENVCPKTKLPQPRSSTTLSGIASTRWAGGASCNPSVIASGLSSPDFGAAPTRSTVREASRPLSRSAAVAVRAVGTGHGRRDTDLVSQQVPRLTERIRDLLRARGLRRAPPRIAVLATPQPVRGPLSVAEIHRRLLASHDVEGPPPDVATVYRTVTTLVEAGVLHALSVEGGVTTYGVAEDPHHRAVCTRCGTIIEVPAQRLTSALEHAIEGSSFTLSDRAGLTLHGLCPKCQPL